MLSRNAVSSCRSFNLARRLHKQTIARSLATVTEGSNNLSASSSHPPPVQKHDAVLPKANIDTSVILTRAPMITRTPTPFERAYYAYQSRIQRALFTHFPTEFYFKQGSLLESKFVKEEEEREREAFGSLRAQRKDASSSEEGAEASTARSVNAPKSADIGAEADVIMPRITEADRTGDVHSLDRAGERNLYLLVQGKDKIWRFPQGSWKEGELLHETADRDLKAQCGVFMDTWIVSRNPIGVYEPALSPASPDAPQTYVFFYKAHILAGQVRPDAKSVDDFAWLTKQEIQKRVEQKYWDGVKDMLSDF